MRALAVLVALVPVLSVALAEGSRRALEQEQPLTDRVWIAAGWFTFGVSDEDLDYARRLCVRERTPHALRLRGCASEELFASELPARRVFLSRYALDRFEVSRAELERCIAAGRCDPPAFQTQHPQLTQPEQPAVGLSWSGAQQLCSFRGGRLPSEAEWERAARGDSSRHFPWGHFYNEALANHGVPSLSFDPSAGTPSPEDGFPYLAPVTAFADARSVHGLVQMAGNVWEWTRDSFAGVRAQPLSVNPSVELDNGLRTVRGGSFRAPAVALRVTHREGRAEGRGYVDVGVRCAYDALRSGSPPRRRHDGDGSKRLSARRVHWHVGPEQVRASRHGASAPRADDGAGAVRRATMEDGMRTIVRVLAQALMLALVLGSSVAEAQSAPNRARARELYAQGQQLFRQGDFQGAQRAFEDAYRAVPNPVVLLSISECQVRNEDFGGALTSLRQYLTEKPTAPDRPQVEAQIANLEAKPGFVSLESVPPGAMIWVDGENTGYITPNELSLRAGPHMIALTADGFVRFEQRVEVAIGSRQRLSLTLTPEPAPVVAEPTPEETPAEQPVTERSASPAVWAAVGIAGVTAITGTGLGIAALQKDKEYKDNPSKELSDKGERLALFADVNFGIAVVAGITAVVIYLTSAEPTEVGEQAWVVSPAVNQRELGVASTLRF